MTRTGLNRAAKTPEATVPTRLSTALILCLIESRPVVLLMFMLRFSIAVAFVAPGPDRIAEVVAGTCGWLLATVAVYLGNGLCDRLEDGANGLGRPLARGALDQRFALVVTMVCAVGAVVLATVVSPVSLAATIGFLALGYAYSAPARPLKAHGFGTAATGVAGMALTYVAGWAAAGSGPSTGLLAFAVVLSLWTGIAGSTKDFAHVAGDTLAGRRTLPVLLGHDRARAVIAGAIVVVAAVSVHAAAVVDPVLWPASVTITVGVSRMLHWMIEEPDSKSVYQAFMRTQIVAHVVTTVLLLVF